MTAINPIGSTNPNQQVDPTDFRTRMQQALAPVAQLFGETTDQLMSELQSGKTSLSALAQSKGVSQTDLVNAIKQGLSQNASSNGQTLSDSQLTNIANRIANQVHGAGGHHHHHHGGGGGGLSAIASTSSTSDSSSTSSTTSQTSQTDELLQLLEAQSTASTQTAPSFDQTF